MTEEEKRAAASQAAARTAIGLAAMGIGPNEIVQLNASSQIPVVSGA